MRVTKRAKRKSPPKRNAFKTHPPSSSPSPSQEVQRLLDSHFFKSPLPFNFWGTRIEEKIPIFQLPRPQQPSWYIQPVMPETRIQTWLRGVFHKPKPRKNEPPRDEDIEAPEDVWDGKLKQSERETPLFPKLKNLIDTGSEDSHPIYPLDPNNLCFCIDQTYHDESCQHHKPLPPTQLLMRDGQLKSLVSQLQVTQSCVELSRPVTLAPPTDPSNKRLSVVSVDVQMETQSQRSSTYVIPAKRESWNQSSGSLVSAGHLQSARQPTGPSTQTLPSTMTLEEEKAEPPQRSTRVTRGVGRDRGGRVGKNYGGRGGSKAKERALDQPWRRQ